MAGSVTESRACPVRRAAFTPGSNIGTAHADRRHLKLVPNPRLRPFIYWCQNQQQWDRDCSSEQNIAPQSTTLRVSASAAGLSKVVAAIKERCAAMGKVGASGRSLERLVRPGPITHRARSDSKLSFESAKPGEGINAVTGPRRGSRRRPGCHLEVSLPRVSSRQGLGVTPGQITPT